MPWHHAFQDIIQLDKAQEKRQWGWLLYKRPLSRLGPEKEVFEKGYGSDIQNQEEFGNLSSLTHRFEKR